MLVSSLSFLVVLQFPIILTSSRARFIIGLASSLVLGMAVLVLGGSLPLFITVLAIIAILPGINNNQQPSIIAFVLAGSHITRGIIMCVISDPVDSDAYYQVNILNFIYYFYSRFFFPIMSSRCQFSATLDNRSTFFFYLLTIKIFFFSLF